MALPELPPCPMASGGPVFSDGRFPESARCSVVSTLIISRLLGAAQGSGMGPVSPEQASAVGRGLGCSVPRNVLLKSSLSDFRVANFGCSPLIWAFLSTPKEKRVVVRGLKSLLSDFPPRPFEGISRNHEQLFFTKMPGTLGV